LISEPRDLINSVLDSFTASFKIKIVVVQSGVACLVQAAKIFTGIQNVITLSFGVFEP